MRYQPVSNLFCYLIFTLSIICFPLMAKAAIVHTELVFYDLAAASQRSYAFSMLPVADGAHVTLRRNDDKYSLSADVVTCLSIDRQTSADREGYMWLKNKESQHTDPDLLPFLTFTDNNRLRIAIKPLANAQYLLLDRDSLTVLAVDPTMMTLSAAGCQR